MIVQNAPEGEIELILDYATKAFAVKRKHYLEAVWAGVKRAGAKCDLHFHKFSADFRSKRYGIGKEKGRAIADSTFTES